ncbi:hypothetical protein CEXT_791931 [Caerostris extrusa]|uniref:Sm domain-containing protein n=1 Tax=Caerostris extrusa TaxID=172846 RepID=A0AAV4RGA5_CAEEX|nr:hypothetical protein CEXT_791931 [Caerostris extrusa]
MSDYCSRRSDDDQRKRHRRRSSSGSRRSSSGSPEPRDANSLPKQFGKMEDHLEEEEEGNNVLVRMREGFNNNPIGKISAYLEDNVRIKVLIRNTKEVRGICTGTVVAFDKHWNLLMTNVHEVYIKPKKTKVPFLLDRKIGDQMPDLSPRVPKVKKERSPEKAAPMDEESAPVVEESAAKAEEDAEKAEEDAEKAAKRKEKKKKQKNAGGTNPRPMERNHAQLFIRGDNIVMVYVPDTTSNGPDAKKD